jgi:hypothetical protein
MTARMNDGKSTVARITHAAMIAIVFVLGSGGLAAAQGACGGSGGTGGGARGAGSGTPNSTAAAGHSSLSTGTTNAAPERTESGGSPDRSQSRPRFGRRVTQGSPPSSCEIADD